MWSSTDTMSLNSHKVAYNMQEFKYIPQQELFRCSVELTSAVKCYIMDGVPQSLEQLRERGIGVAEQNGALQIVPADGALLQMIFVRVSPKAANYSTQIVAKSGTRSSVVLCAHTISDERFVTEDNIEIIAESGASLDILVMQNENPISMHRQLYRIRQEERSTLSLNLTTLNGGSISNKIDAQLCGKGITCELNGLYLADGSQTIDTNVNLVHNVGECTSRQLFKGILGGSAKTTFNGEVLVKKDAQKTEAYQANNNLLVSDMAKAVSQPHLVIYADDVKCSHGSTIGSLAEESLFYMRSRGISESEARILQQQAFAGAVLEKISNRELRERLNNLIERRLRGEETFCRGCSKNCC